MNKKKSPHTERGQALVLIALSMIALIAMTGLTVDGSMLYSDRRHAQNAADSAALAGALAKGRNEPIESTAANIAAQNGYIDSATTPVLVDPVAITDPLLLAASGCPAKVKTYTDVTVTITSTINTTFASIVGVNSMKNTVTATARACGIYVAPMLDGNAIVSLAPSGIGFDAGGNPKWDIVGGGVFSNSIVQCNGNAGLTAPSVSAALGRDLTCNTVVITATAQPSGAIQPFTWEDYRSQLPPTPTCNVAAVVSGTGVKEVSPAVGATGTQGSNVALSGSMHFAPGLYCITEHVGPYNDQISGTGVTFFVANTVLQNNGNGFELKFTSSGSLVATAPTSGYYKGVLFYMEPKEVDGVLVNTGAIDFRGSGEATMTGAIVAPSADVTLYGTSDAAQIKSQIISYHVKTGGTAKINITYDPEQNWNPTMPVEIFLLK